MKYMKNQTSMEETEGVDDFISLTASIFSVIILPSNLIINLLK
jgi:hypothetical protein